MAAHNISRPAGRYDASRAHMPVHHDRNSKVQLDRTMLQMSKYQVVAILPPSKGKELWLCDKCSTIEGLVPVQGSLLRSSQSLKPSLLEAWRGPSLRQQPAHSPS